MIVRDLNPPSKKTKQSVVIQEKTNGKSSHIHGLIYIIGISTVILLTLNFVKIWQSGLQLKINITNAASAGFEKIIGGVSAIQKSQFETAKNLFTEAKDSFEKIQTHVWFTSPRIPALSITDPVFEASQSIINTGRYLAEAGDKFASVAENLKFLPKIFFQENVYPAIQPRESLTEKLKKNLPQIFESSQSLQKANEVVKKIPEKFIPSSLREKFRFAKDALNILSGFMTNLQSDMPAILALLGDEQPHTFLILLQNDAELRPTGGFIGNYIILETNDGYITKNNVFDIYSADHQLIDAIEPPREILPANNRWFMRDSNYSAHFPISAEKASWFLEREGGPGVDTVIAINQSFISELLRLTGPIKIRELTQPITNTNMSVILSYIIESKLTGSEEPKAILKSFIPEFQKAIFKNIDPVELMPLLRTAIENKNVLAYSKNSAVQTFFEKNRFAGLMKQLEPKEDYLNIAHTSVSGNKSDDDVSEIIEHDTYLNADGSLENDLKITRIHNWNKQTEAYVKNIITSFGFDEISNKVWKILGRDNNVNMLRIYVPGGTILEDSAGTNVQTFFDEKTGKTYFSARMDTPLSGSSVLRLRYRLPFKLNLDPVDKYQLTVQRQAGQSNITLRKRIFPESGITNYKYFPDEASFDLDGILNFETQLEKDMTFSIVWGK